MFFRMWNLFDFLVGYIMHDSYGKFIYTMNYISFPISNMKIFITHVNYKSNIINYVSWFDETLVHFFQHN